MCLHTETACKYIQNRTHCQKYKPWNCSCKHRQPEKSVAIFSGLFQFSFPKLISNHDPASASNSIAYTGNDIL